MYEGEVVQIGTPEDLFERPAHTFVGYFIGSPGMNVLPVDDRRRTGAVLGDAGRSSCRAPIAICRRARRSSSASGRNSSALGRERPRHAGDASPQVDDVGRYRVVARRPRRPSLQRRSPPRTREIAGRPRAASSSIRPASTSTPTAGWSKASVGGSGLMDKTWNNSAWFMVLPVLMLVAFNAIIPLMTVVNYSVQETFGDNVFFFDGVDWFQDVLHSERFHAALLRQLIFTFIILADRDPARRGDRADDAAEGRLGFRLPRADGAAAAHSVERRRRHLEHLRAARHRPARPRAERRSASTTTTRASRSTPGSR